MANGNIDDLNDAKKRLRCSLEKLELVVKKKVADATSKSNLNNISQNIEYTKELTSIKDSFACQSEENKQLRDENRTLQSRLGKEQEEIISLKANREKLGKRVDTLINDLTDILRKKEIP